MTGVEQTCRLCGRAGTSGFWPVRDRSGALRVECAAINACRRRRRAQDKPSLGMSVSDVRPTDVYVPDMPPTEHDDDPVAEALRAMGRQLATDPRDWSLDRTDARLYAVLCGWNDPDGQNDAWADLAARHGWDDEYVAVLKRRRAAVAALTGDTA